VHVSDVFFEVLHEISGYVGPPMGHTLENPHRWLFSLSLLMVQWFWFQREGPKQWLLSTLLFP